MTGSGGRLSLVAFVCGLAASSARADVRLLIEEPIHFLGHLSSTGHSALLLDEVCTDDYRHVRPCRPEEAGSVISRYQGIGGYDWLAVPTSGYLFATDSLREAPASVSEQDVHALRAAYGWRHFRKALPMADEDDLEQLAGASYRRRILVIRLHTTHAQELRLMDWLNGSRNKSRFNFFLNNCADFNRKALNVLFPGAVRRSFIFDAGMTTPKQLAHGMHRYGDKHPELAFEVTTLPQIPGDLPRSGHVYGVTESFVKTKVYLYPLAILQPEGIGTVIAVGLFDRRYSIQSAAQDVLEVGADELSSLLEEGAVN